MVLIYLLFYNDVEVYIILNFTIGTIIPKDTHVYTYTHTYTHRIQASQVASAQDLRNKRERP